MNNQSGIEKKAVSNTRSLGGPRAASLGVRGAGSIASDRHDRRHQRVGRSAQAYPLAIPPRLVLLVSLTGVSVINYGFGLIAGRLLSPAEFGLLAFAQTLILIFATVLQSGIPWSLTRAVAGVKESHRAALVRGAAVANLVLGIGLGLILATLFYWGPLRSGLETGAITTIVVLALPFMAFLAVARATALGVEHFGIYAAIQVVEVVSKAALGIALIVVGTEATGAIGGFLCGAVSSAVLGVVYLHRRLKIRISRNVELPSLRTTGPMFGALLGSALLLSQDLIALKLLSGDKRALTGYYQAGTILANAAYFLVSGALVPVLFTQLAHFTTIRQTRKAVGELLAAAAVLFVPIEAALIVAPRPALGFFFPESYAPGAGPLRLLALGNCAAIVVVILSATFQAIGRARTAARVLLGVTACEMVALALVVPTRLADGAASVFVAATFLSSFILGGVYLHEVGADAVKPLFAWLLRYVTTITAGLAVGIAVYSLREHLLVAASAGGLVYLTSAFFMRTIHGPWALIVGRAQENT